MKKHLRKAKNGCLLTAAALVGLMTGTYAFQTDSDYLENQLTIGYNETTVTEDFPEPVPKPIEDDPEYKKTVAVASTADPANTDSFVRARISCSNQDLGKCVVFQGLNKTDWTLQSDGYYYYNHVLPAGGKTAPLFTGVSLNSSALGKKPDLYADELRIFVYEESVEAKEGYTSLEAFQEYQTSGRG